MDIYTRPNLPITELLRIRCPSLPRFLHWQFVSFVLFFASIGTFFLLSSDPAIAKSFSLSQASSSETYLEEGLRAFQRGDFEQAVLKWTEAARLYERAGKLHEQSEALTYLAQAYQSIGQYKQALKSLELALAFSQEIG